MNLSKAFTSELEQEGNSTRKILSRVPIASFSWSPHPKSMQLLRLSTHIADLYGWIDMIMTTNELDLAATRERPAPPADTESLLATLDQNMIRAKEVLSQATDNDFAEAWTLRKGDHVILTLPRAAVLRSMVFNHSIHHRGQLSVFLRLLEVPVPGMYGPSADDAN
jgi:uncharacterized damage-inducible protein DinB